jgi:hypothetical protein
MQRVLHALGRKSLRFLFALVLLGLPAPAQQKQHLELIVTDTTGAIVPHATVVLQASGAAGPTASGSTDAAGEFDAQHGPGRVRSEGVAGRVRAR